MTAPVFPRNAAALLIGIGTYARADRIAGLQYAARDAKAVARTLRDDSLCGFPKHRVMVLSEARASRAAVVRHLSRWLPQEARGADVVLLYFAGHGTVETIGGREEGYLLPYDADPDDVVTHGVAMSDVARWIDGLDARVVIVCLDCCHAGGILPAQGVSLRASERDMQIRPQMLEQLSGRGRFLLASCDRGQKSIEADELRHGLFTYHLLRGLAGAGDRDGDGLVGVSELFSYISQAVSHDARTRFAREQTPWTMMTCNTDVPLAVVRDKDRKPASTVDQPVAQETTEDQPILDRLRQLRRRPSLDEVPFLFRHLAHRAEPVRLKATAALAALDWDAVVPRCEQLARDGSEADAAAVLDGLEAMETRPRVVALLDRLATLLKGPARDRAAWLLDRKRLALERERLAEVFKEAKSIYEIVKVLGPGTYTGAYLARQALTGLEVVVRVLRAEFVGQPVVRSHFLDLGTKTVRLVHQNLVLTREIGALPDCGLFYTVRDFIRGVTLREVLESGRRFDPPQAGKILRQVLDALAPLHREGLVHAGVKPSNIFLTREDHVVLGDPSLPLPAVGFDLPRLAYDYRYAPPELFRGGGTLTVAADFYSLGCVAFELYQGQPPFVADSPFQLIARHDRDAVPPLTAVPAADRWVRRLLAKTPGERPGSLDEVRQALAEAEEVRLPRTTRLDAEAAPTGPSPTLAPGFAGSAESVHLLGDQSLAEFDGRQSIVNMTRGDAAAWSVDDTGAPPLPERLHAGTPVEIPGYEILELLGRGGMGVVYKARDVALNRVVALKMVLDGRHAGAAAMRRFLTEAQAAAAIAHPGIVQIHAIGTHDGLPYFVLEFCPGGSLQQRLGGTPLPPREAAEVVSRLAAAVQAAHSQGIIHRDLKPANVLLDAAGQPKISDFGLARQERDDEMYLTTTGTVLGTPAYMSPEQWQGRKDITPAADLYSLGCILYECLTGRQVYAAGSPWEMASRIQSTDPDPPRKLNPAVPKDLETICLRCLEKEPARRYASAADLAADLDRWLTGTPVQAKRRSREPGGRKWWWPFGR